MPPTLKIKNIDAKGLMLIQFDQTLRTITNITEIDEQVLDLKIRRNQNYDEENGSQKNFNYTWTT